MRGILGIGNPEKKYLVTKHNLGFIILDFFAQKHNLLFKPSKKDYYYAGGMFHASPFFLIKPTTYVNRSGIAAKDFIEEHQISVQDLLIVSDDVNLDFGKIRVRTSGGDGGHNGLKSIIYHLNDDNFPRVRFGIGNEFDSGELADYVLSKIDKKTFKSLKPNLEFAVQLIENFIVDGNKGILDFFSKNSYKINNSTDKNNSEEN